MPPARRAPAAAAKPASPRPRPAAEPAAKAPAAPFDAARALLQAYETNDRINQYLLEHLSDAAWRAAPPDGKGRTVAAIVAHMHNVRVMWLEAAGAAALPPQLDKERVTRAEAADALVASRGAVATLLADALAGDGRVKGFKPDVVGFFGYLVAHDAHHRGQIAMLARQTGHPLPKTASFGLWEWGSRGRA